MIPGAGSTKRCDVTRPTCPEYRGRRRIMVPFDSTTFAVIRDLAVKRGTSFAEQVRLLVAAALEQSA